MGFPMAAVKNPPAGRSCRSHSFDPWVRKIQGMEEGMETHASILAWRIPWTEEHIGLGSMESQRVRHD